ncbi:MAG: hypothetical protein IJT44_09780 [Clostridia bacterium]|nr:hypothetical protein [Clostridia bacterium]
MGAKLQLWLHPLATFEVEQNPRIINGFAGFALLLYGNVLKNPKQTQIRNPYQIQGVFH